MLLPCAAPSEALDTLNAVSVTVAIMNGRLISQLKG